MVNTSLSIAELALLKRALLGVADQLLLALDEGTIRGQLRLEAMAKLQGSYAAGDIELESFERHANCWQEPPYPAEGS